MSAIARFLQSLDDELRHVMPDGERAHTIEELRAHLTESAAELALQGEPDPEAMAVASFGDEHELKDELVASHEGRGLPSAEKRALAIAAVAVGLPVFADLAMDFSSWFTGSDSATYLVGIPMAVCAIVFGIRCIQVRRVLLVPILGMVLAGFMVSTVLGGYSQAADPNGYGTRARGTASQRLGSLVRETLPRNEAIQAEIRDGRLAFDGTETSDAVARFRVAEGYLAPGLSEEWANVWKGDPRAARWLIDGVRLTAKPTFAEAASVWHRDGARFAAMAQGGVDGDLQEIAELRGVVASPWIDSVRAQWPNKVFAAVSGFVALLALNTLGSGLGVIQRFRNRRKAA